MGSEWLLAAMVLNSILPSTTLGKCNVGDSILSVPIMSESSKLTQDCGIILILGTRIGYDRKF